MPYTITIYPDENLSLVVGDLFKVVRVTENVTDLHWGSCTMAELEKIPATTETCEWTIQSNIFEDGTSSVYTECGMITEAQKETLTEDVVDYPFCHKCGKRIVVKDANA